MTRAPRGPGYENGGKGGCGSFEPSGYNLSKRTLGQSYVSASLSLSLWRPCTLSARGEKLSRCYSSFEVEEVNEEKGRDECSFNFND